jgi:hypothetical protein
MNAFIELERKEGTCIKCIHRSYLDSSSIHCNQVRTIRFLEEVKCILLHHLQTFEYSSTVSPSVCQVVEMRASGNLKVPRSIHLKKEDAFGVIVAVVDWLVHDEVSSTTMHTANGEMAFLVVLLPFGVGLLVRVMN